MLSSVMTSTQVFVELVSALHSLSKKLELCCQMCLPASLAFLQGLPDAGFILAAWNRHGNQHLEQQAGRATHAIGLTDTQLWTAVDTA